VIVLSSNEVPKGETYEQQFKLRRDALLGGIAPQMANAEKGAVPAPTILVTQVPTTTSASTGQLAEVQRIRQYSRRPGSGRSYHRFRGKAIINTTVPDSITTWVLRAVALSKEKGLGIAEAQLTVFQPFFLSIDLPYSAVRGEESRLRFLSITIWNSRGRHRQNTT